MSWLCRNCGPVEATIGSYREQKCEKCGGPVVMETTADMVLEFNCPGCAMIVDALAPRCPHCLRWFIATHCSRCDGLVDPEASRCSQCDAETAFQDDSSTREMRCPTCELVLSRETMGGISVHECPRCHGLLIAQTALHEWTIERAQHAPHDVPLEPVPANDRTVRYRRCPECGRMMNRVNFGPGSGVIIDVCGKKLVWLDSGELTALIEFARSGKLDRAEKRHAEEAKRERAESLRPNQAHDGGLDWTMKHQDRIDFGRTLTNVIRAIFRP